MSPRRRFPFGQTPPPAPAERMKPAPPRANPEATATLAGDVPRRPVLPFRPAPECEPDLLRTAPKREPETLVLLPPPAPATRRETWSTAAWAALLVVDIVVLVYLAVTWRQ